MRRVVMWCLLVALSLQVLWSGGTPEGKELRILGDIYPDVWAYCQKALQDKYPKAKITRIMPSMADGSTMTMDAMLAAGNPANVYTDYMGRVSKYVTPKFALELAPPNVQDFLPGTLEPLKRDGKLYGLPMPGGAQGMVINLKILKDIGEEKFDFSKWTTTDFLRLGDKVKAKGLWATYLFAGNQSGDYLWMNWMSTFGAQMFKSGDYSKTVLDTTGGEKFFAWMDMLVKKGYAPPAAAVLTDDDYALEWAQGKIFAGAWYPSWVKPYFDTVKKQGMKGADFDYRFVAFPRADGVGKIPMAGSYGGVVVYNGKDSQLNSMGTTVAYVFTDTQSQKIMAQGLQGYPTRKSAQTPFTDPHWNAISQLVAANGMLDLGITMPKFSEIRALSVPELQAVYTGKKTPAEAFRAYVATVNKALAR